jgi:hypothetical protein
MIKARIDRYNTVFACRHAANQRSDMSRSLDFILRCIDGSLKQLKKLTQQQERQRPLLIAPDTPPRRLLRGQLPTEKLLWAAPLQSGYTPCCGRSLNSHHQMREEGCDGRVLLYRVPDPNSATVAANGRKQDVRQPCRLCKQNTNFYCTGCKNYLCFGSQALTDKKAQQLAKLCDGIAPKGFVKIPLYNAQKNEWKHLFAVNSCYLIQHKQTFDAKQDWGEYM